MKKIETFGNSKNGKLHIIKRAEFWQSFAIVFKESDRLRVIIEKVYSKRSGQQNRYYWGVVISVLLFEVQAQGNEISRDELHEELLKMFAPKKEIKNKNGEFFEVPMRSHEMNRSEMSDYTESVRRWAADFWGCNIPDPGEQTEIF